MASVDTNDELQLLAIRENELRRRNAELDSQLELIEIEQGVHSEGKSSGQGVRSNITHKSLKHENVVVTPTSTRSSSCLSELQDHSVSPASSRMSYGTMERCTISSPSVATAPSQVVKKLKPIARKTSSTEMVNPRAPSKNILEERKTGKDNIGRLTDARLSAMPKKIEDTNGNVQSLVHDLEVTKQQLQEQTSQTKKLEKALRDAQNKANDFESKFAGQQTVVEELKKEIQLLRQELASAQKVAKTVETEYKRGEIRMRRALEDCDKYKATLAKATDESRQNGATTRNEKDELVKQIKTLEQQRRDLLIAFKKQLKLIDVLKRQKLHAEAATVLNIAEEEFMKVIDWGSTK